MSTLNARLEKLELEAAQVQRESCAAAWARIGALLSELPIEILGYLAKGDDDKVPAEYDDILNEVYRLWTPEVEQYAESIQPPGAVESWTDEQLMSYLT